MREELLIFLASEIDAEVKNIEHDLAMGHAKDFGDYKFACGRYRGLLNAKDIIIATAERLDRADD